MRKLTLEEKIITFKTIAISRIVFQSFVTTIPKHILNEVEKIRRKNMKLFVTTINLES